MQASLSQPFRAGPIAPRRLAPRRSAVTCRAAVAPALTDIEKKALGAYRAESAITAGKQEALLLLQRAARTKAVNPELVEGALLAVEQFASQESGGPVPSIAGRWRLLFGTATKFRPFQYIPVKEDFVLDEANKTVALESSIGPFEFFIRGTMSAWRPESGELDFQFTKVDIVFNGNKVYEVIPKTKPKTYTFFHVGPDTACARSSAGGVALLVK